MEPAAQVAIKAEPLAIFSFFLYLLLILAIGVLSAKFSSSGLSEFFLAGRKLKEFVVGLSAVVSGRSARLLIGVTAGFISGTAVTIAWNQVPFLKSIIYELVPAFFVSSLLTVIISILTAPPEEAGEELKSIAAKYRR